METYSLAGTIREHVRFIHFIAAQVGIGIEERRFRRRGCLQDRAEEIVAVSHDRVDNGHLILAIVAGPQYPWSAGFVGLRIMEEQKHPGRIAELEFYRTTYGNNNYPDRMDSLVMTGGSSDLRLHQRNSNRWWS